MLNETSCHVVLLPACPGVTGGSAAQESEADKPYDSSFVEDESYVLTLSLR